MARGRKRVIAKRGKARKAKATAKRIAKQAKPIELYYWPTPNGFKISIMEEQIATLAGREEVGKSRNAGQRRFQQFLPTASYFVRRCPNSAVGDKLACGPDIAAAGFAVQPDVHQAARPQ